MDKKPNFYWKSSEKRGDNFASQTTQTNNNQTRYQNPRNINQENHSSDRKDGFQMKESFSQPDSSNKIHFEEEKRELSKKQYSYPKGPKYNGNRFEKQQGEKTSIASANGINKDGVSVLDKEQSIATKPKEYCHWQQVGECNHGVNCYFLHTDIPLGICIRNHCNECEKKKKKLALSRHKSPQIQEKIDKILQAIEAHDEKITNAKNELRENLMSEQEIKDLLVFKINQLIEHRNLFLAQMSFLVPKAIEKIDKLDDLSQSLKSIETYISFFTKGLPAFSVSKDVRDELKKMDKRFCLVRGETGSGKTTQVPQFLYESLKYSSHRIICVQPRKVAAISLAKRVAEELNVILGEEVGYQVGLGKPKYVDEKDTQIPDCLNGSKTKILFVTESILLKKIAHEIKKGVKSKFFQNAKAILIDEVHERSLLSDLIFGILKTTFLDRYPQMKIFLASATVDVEKFKNYFDQCREIQIPGRTFPVEIKYKPMFEENYVEGAVEVLKEVYKKNKMGETQYQGHVIVFLTSVDEMEDAKDLIDKFGPDFHEKYTVLFLHGRLSNDDQQKIFDTKEKRFKVILATKIAESSITINGVRIVIDSGFDKDAFYDSKKGITVLETDWISKASAQQRAGRAGRTAPGVCYRLYSEDTFQKLEMSKKPEIAKVNLDIALLKIIDFEIDPRVFPYFEPPEKSVIENTLKTLQILGALDSQNRVTIEGKIMMEMSTEPRKTKAIIQGSQRGCLDEVIKILAMESYDRSLFLVPQDKEERIKFANNRIGDDSYQSDHLDYLYIYQKWEEEKEYQKRNDWCEKNRIKKWTLGNVSKMIKELQKEIYIIQKKNEDFTKEMQPKTTSLSINQKKENVLKCITASCLVSLAKYSGLKNLGYVNIRDGFLFQVHGSSNQKIFPAIQNIDQQFIIYSLMENPRGLNLAKTVSLVPSAWLTDTSIVPLNFRREFENGLTQNYSYDQTCKQLPSWAIKKFKVMFRNQIENFTNYMEKNKNCTVKMIPSSSTSITFAHSKAAKDDVELFYNNLKKDLDNEIAKESIIYNLDDANYRPIIKDGLAISELLLQHEYISVSYSNLPSGMSKGDVLRLFGLKENDVNYITINNQGSRTMGDIRFLDKNSARNFIEINQQKINQKIVELQPVLTFYKKKQFFEACQLKVTFSTAKSKCEAKITFENEYDAEMVKERLGKNPKIDGKEVQISQDKKNPFAFYLKNLNSLTDENVLKNYVVGELSLPKINVHRDNSTASQDWSDEDRFMFNSLFTQFLSKEEIDEMYFTYKNAHKYENLMQVWISLPNRKVAEKIVDELDGKAEKFGTQRLRIKMQNSTTLKVNKYVFVIMSWALQQRADEIKNLHPGDPDDPGRLQIKIDTQEKNQRDQRGGNDQSFFKIKITSKHYELNRQIANQFERIVQGTEFNCKSQVDKFKLFSNEMKDFYQKLQEEINKSEKKLYIAWNYKTKKVTLHSPFPNIIEYTQIKIQEALDNQIKFECIDVNKYNIKRLSNYVESLQKSESSVSVSLDYMQKKLLLKGEKKGIDFVIQNMEKFLLVNKKSSESQCPICFDDLDENCCLLYHCQHKVCKECFVQYVLAEADKPSIVCLIPDCKKVVSLKDIKEGLSPEQINKVIDQHVLLYMRANHGTYRNCPTADCKYIYLAGNEVYKCESCNESYCVKNPERTHREHPGETCHQFLTNSKGEEEFKKMIESKLIKITKCCGVPIMKSGGCNHMTCTNCPKHFCWKCFAVFNTADETYRHLRTCTA